MPANIDIGNLTDEETAALATRCLEALSLAEKVQAVLGAFHNNDARSELIQWLEEANAEAEAEGEEEDEA
jgi:hypothetical protein